MLAGSVWCGASLIVGSIHYQKFYLNFLKVKQATLFGDSRAAIEYETEMYPMLGEKISYDQYKQKK